MPPALVGCSEDVERAELHGHPRPGHSHLGDGVLPGALARAAHDDEVVLLNTGAGVIYPGTVTVDAPTIGKDGVLEL